MGLKPRWLHRATFVVVGLVVACAIDPAAEAAGPSGGPAGQDPARSDERERMVARQIRARGVRDDPRVLQAMQAVLHHRFVPDQLQDEACADTPLPIGSDQTISQPYIVAYMTQALQMPAEAKVLEIGTGSGYQAAVLAEIAQAVHTIEIVPKLTERSGRILEQPGYDNVHTRVGNGYRGGGGGGAVRCHHRDRRPRPHAAGPGGTAGDRRAVGHPGGTVRSGDADRYEDDRRLDVGDDDPGMFCPDDRRGPAAMSVVGEPG